MFLSDKNEIIDKMKEHTTISPHAISDLHYHIARNNMDVVAHICKFFGMKVHILSDGFTILEKIEMKDNIDPSSSCKSIW